MKRTPDLQAYYYRDKERGREESQRERDKRQWFIQIHQLANTDIPQLLSATHKDANFIILSLRNVYCSRHVCRFYMFNPLKKSTHKRRPLDCYWYLYDSSEML